MVFNGAAGLTPFYGVVEFPEMPFDTVEELVAGLDAFMADAESSASIATVLIDGLSPLAMVADEAMWLVLADRVMRLGKRGKNVWLTVSGPVTDVPEVLQRACDLVATLSMPNGSRVLKIVRSRWNTRLAVGEQFENFDVRQTLGALLAPAPQAEDPVRKEMERALQYIQDGLSRLAPKGATKGPLSRAEARTLWAEAGAATTIDDIKPIRDRVRTLLQTAEAQNGTGAAARDTKDTKGGKNTKAGGQ